jgi:gamma-glutamyltranspeptidase/glutathione hydrolase
MARPSRRHDDGSALAIGSPGAGRITTANTAVLAGFVHGGVGVTLVSPDGHLEAAADPRRDGAVRLVRG